MEDTDSIQSKRALSIARHYKNMCTSFFSFFLPFFFSWFAFFAFIIIICLFIIIIFVFLGGTSRGDDSDIGRQV